MNVRDRLAGFFLNDLLADAPGRAFVLNQAAVAEATDEGRLFDLVLEQVDDPALAKMVRKHRDDETRHAAMFSACVARQGVDPGELPTDLRLLDVIDRRLGGFFAKPIEDALGVMETYLLLQVIEERALHQFSLLEAAMRRHDPETADVIAQIAADERRHLRYCHAIARRYAPDPLTQAETLARFRLVEARAFQEHSRRNMAHMLDHGLVRSKVRTALWRAVATLTARSDELPLTEFATATPLDRAPLAAAA